MEDKTPNNCVIENFLHHDEEVMCEVCCEMVKSCDMNACGNCVYKCCEKCFRKKYIMSLKEGKPDGRCFGCRDELVLGFIEISA
jgi:hypothetical protein